jgi:hypothetical protein
MEPKFPAITARQTGPRLLPILLLSILGTALVIGGAVYFYEKNQQEIASQNLQAQIDSLKARLVTPSPTVEPTATPAPTASPTATSTAVTTCLSENLTLSLVDNGGGTAGTYYTNIALTNSGTQSCTLTGFPKASLLDKNGATLGTATESALVTSSKVTLTAGKTAYAALGFPNPDNFDTGTCSAAAAKISVTPPGTTTPLLIATTRPFCPGFSVSALSATKL